MKSQEQLNEQAEVAQTLRDGMARGLGSPGLADLILNSDWLAERDAKRSGMGKIKYTGKTILEQFGGKHVTLTIDQFEVHGTLTDLDKKGWITVRTGDGPMHFNSAHVSQIRLYRSGRSHRQVTVAINGFYGSGQRLTGLSDGAA